MTSLQPDSSMVAMLGKDVRHSGTLLGVSGKKVKVPVELVNNHIIALTVLIYQ